MGQCTSICELPIRMTQSPLFFVWRRPGLSGTEATPDAPLKAPITWGSLGLWVAVLNLFAPVDGARVVHHCVLSA